MKEISLTQGLVALVDEDLFDSLNQFNWYASLSNRTFYAYRNDRSGGEWKRVSMHRVIMGAGEGIQVDHIDHDGLNNLRSNLRCCNSQQNGFNSQLPMNNTSGFKGVSLHRRHGKWHAQITVNGRNIHLGYFASAEESARAYDAAAFREWGEFAFLNFPVVVAS